MCVSDDLVVFAKNGKELGTKLKIRNYYLAIRTLRINVNKTKVMVLGKKNSIVNITKNNPTREKVQK